MKIVSSESSAIKTKKIVVFDNYRPQMKVLSYENKIKIPKKKII